MLSTTLSSSSESDSSSLSSSSSSDEEILSPKSKRVRPSDNANTFQMSQNPEQHEVVFNERAANMMLNMGYREGHGLGKHNQGRKEIVEISKQKGRRGLGVTYKEEGDLENAGWDFDKEKVDTLEEIEWMDDCELPVPSYEEMKKWIAYGKPLTTLEGCTNFIDREVVEDVNKGKNSLDNIFRNDLLAGRARSNPFEQIKAGIFLNRAAMKIANMDQRLNFLFTNPRDSNGECLFTDPEDIMYFADICAGPGGFSEYVLWRMKNNRQRFSHGFGFTLRESNDFKLHNFYAGPSECFEPFYGQDDDGDIFKPHNLTSFRDFVMNRTDGVGVCFTMADGGFSVEEDRNNQEILSKQLYLCQCLCALMIVRTDGNFVTKLFDIFSDFSVGLIYLMRRAFRRVAIIKPVTSRPANSERYLVCENKREDSGAICDYLFEVNKQICYKRLNSDILDIVPLHLLTETPEFYDYIRHSNYKIAYQQVIALKKLSIFSNNKTLIEKRQGQIKMECFRRWLVPLETRLNPSGDDPDKTFKKFSHIKMNWTPNQVDTYNKAVEHRLNFGCFAVSNVNNVRLYLSVGKVYFWTKEEWRLLDRKSNLKVQLPYGTIVLAEEIDVIKTLKNRKQQKEATLLIYDALVLNTRDISNLDFHYRRDVLKYFVKSITIETSEVVRFRVADTIVLHPHLFDCVELVKLQWEGIPCRCYKNIDETFYKTESMMLMKITNHPWNVEYSNKSQKNYYFNTSSRESSFEINKKISKTFMNCCNQRTFIKWEVNPRSKELSLSVLKDVLKI